MLRTTKLHLGHLLARPGPSALSVLLMACSRGVLGHWRDRQTGRPATTAPTTRPPRAEAAAAAASGDTSPTGGGIQRYRVQQRRPLRQQQRHDGLFVRYGQLLWRHGRRRGGKRQRHPDRARASPPVPSARTDLKATRSRRRHPVRDAGQGVRGRAETPRSSRTSASPVPSTIQVRRLPVVDVRGQQPTTSSSTRAVRPPAGGACTLGANTWIYASSTPGQVITENMPPNVGLQIAQSTQLILNMHFINPGTTTLYPKIKVNLLFAKNVMYPGGARWSRSTRPSTFPAATRRGSRQADGQRARCTAPAGSKFFHDEHAHAQERDPPPGSSFTQRGVDPGDRATRARPATLSRRPGARQRGSIGNTQCVGLWTHAETS